MAFDNNLLIKFNYQTLIPVLPSLVSNQHIPAGLSIIKAASVNIHL
jgi:hypothetical protein